MSEATLELAERLFAAVQAGNLVAVAEIYAPDATGWLNVGNVTRNTEEILRVLRWLRRNVADPRYEDVRREATETGFVQQHILRGTGPSGAPVEIAACIVATVVDGRITRMDEYLDSAALAPLDIPR